MAKAVRFCVLAALVPLLAACATTPATDVICTREARSAVAVELRDGRTGAQLAGPATVIVREGAYADTAAVPAAMPSTGLAYERAGVYDVTVRKAGYREWTRSGVAVDRDECHVRTVLLRAEMEPAS